MISCPETQVDFSMLQTGEHTDSSTNDLKPSCSAEMPKSLFLYMLHTAGDKFTEMCIKSSCSFRPYKTGDKFCIAMSASSEADLNTGVQNFAMLCQSIAGHNIIEYEIELYHETLWTIPDKLQTWCWTVGPPGWTAVTKRLGKSMGRFEVDMTMWMTRGGQTRQGACSLI